MRRAPAFFVVLASVWPALARGAPAVAESAPVHLLGDSGWQVSAPPGFRPGYCGDSGCGASNHASALIQWHRNAKENVPVGVRRVEVEHRETIAIEMVDIRWNPDSRAYGKSACASRNARLTAPTIDGSHYGRATLSYECLTPMPDGSVRAAGEYEIILQSSKPQATGPVKALRASYQYASHAADPKANEIIAKKNLRGGDGLKSYRLMLGTIKPTAKGKTPADQPRPQLPEREAGPVPLLR